MDTNIKIIYYICVRCSLICCGLSRKLPLCCFRGFLRSDILIGTVTVKLQPLETKCDIHDTFDVSFPNKKKKISNLFKLNFIGNCITYSLWMVEKSSAVS